MHAVQECAFAEHDGSVRLVTAKLLAAGNEWRKQVLRCLEF